MNAPQIYLASTSLPRQELLRQMGVIYEVIPIATSEQLLANEAVSVAIERITLEKARAAFTMSNKILPIPVLAADTMVVCEDIILGKPKNKTDAETMLRMLSGKQHSVITGIALIDADREYFNISVTKVLFKVLSDREITAYCNTIEPFDKAGAYGIQGQAALFIRNIDGSYSGVMGLPIFETNELLIKFGINIF